MINKKKVDNTTSGKSEIAYQTPLNPVLSLGVDTDLYNPSGKDYIGAESVDEHQIIEQANEYIAEEELNKNITIYNE